MTDARSSNRNASVAFIFVTILLDAIGIGILIPVLPDVMRRFASNPATVSTYFGLFIGAYALMQFIASPVLGALSDRFGRRPILLFSLLGAACDYLLMAFSPTLWLLFLGRLISGLTGASMTVASSYMADISDDSNRSANFGMIGAGWGIGFIAGPLLGGLLGTLGPKAPFLLAAVLNIVNFAFGLFVLPESLPVGSRRQIALKKLNPLKSIVSVLKPSAFALLIWIYFFLFLAGNVHPVNWTLYTETKFHWSAWQVGLSLSFVGVVIAFSQVVLTRVIIPKIGEANSITLGIIVYSISFALFALATQGWMMYAFMVVFSITGITVPALQSKIGKHVPSNQQGELQGSLVSLASLSSMLAPLIYTYLFVTFTKNGAPFYFPGAAYAAASGICAVALITWLTQKK
ncbi:MFS transporter [bacterium]|nr:MFS transporter [bacterium]